MECFKIQLKGTFPWMICKRTIGAQFVNDGGEEEEWTIEKK